MNSNVVERLIEEDGVVLTVDGEIINKNVDLTQKVEIRETIRRIMGKQMRERNGFTVSYDHEGGSIETGHPRVKFTIYNEEDPVKAVCHALEVLQEIFPGRVNHIDLCTTLVPEVLDNLAKFPKSCKILCLNTNIHSSGDVYIDEHHGGYLRPTFHESEEVRVKRAENVVIQKKRVDKLLEIIEVKEGLIFEGAGRPWSDNEKIRKIDYLTVQYSSKISTEELAQLENKIICLEQTMMIDEDINQILKEIKSGNCYKRLEVLSIEKYEEASADWVDWKDEILKGLGAEKWNQKDRSKRYHIMEKKPSRRYNIANHFTPSIYGGPNMARGIDLTEAYDFLMDNGKRCSVMFDELIVTIFVWHEDTEYEKRKERKRKAEEEREMEAKRAKI